MATLKDTLHADLTTAMKAKDATTLATIRMVLTAISAAEVAGTQARELSDDEVVTLLSREAKRRHEAAAAFRDGGREDKAAAELAEADVIARYLPAPLTADEVRALIADAVAGAAANGITGGRAIGVVMKELKPATNGRFDGGELAALVKQALAGA